MKQETWNVYEMNDCDWWLARSPQEAINDAAKYYGCKPDDEELVATTPRKLSDDELAELQYHLDDNHTGDTHSFKAELNKRIKSGPVPQMFASTEF